MKILLLFVLAGIFSFTDAKHNSGLKTNRKFFNEEPGRVRIATVVFKSQQYCRAEVEDFEFDVHFSVVSATAYFSQGSFRAPVQRDFKGPGLQPLRDLIDRCTPGTVVSFDNIKVKGPDNLVRTISGVSYLLY